MSRKIDIMIVEPSDIIIEGLTSIFNNYNDINIIATLSDTEILHEKIISANPNIIIINPTLLNPLEKQKLNLLIQNRINTSLIALVYQYIESSSLHIFDNTIDIRAPKSSIVQTVRDCYSSQKGKISESYELSERETSVLILVAKGLSSKEIAENLHISVHTVNTHRKNITHKTGIKSVAGLAVYAMIHNLT
jgi:DNA-binding NarL/FixJ family response regulator